ncbi:MAG: carboxypeptidase regulatory-like domain-containing protein [Vicinamibacteria bacterium]
MKLAVSRTLAVLAGLALLLSASQAQAQGVTTGSIAGVVMDMQKQAVPGASVIAVHTPSGTRYEATSQADGRFLIPGVRVGGPYTVTATLSGFQPVSAKDLVVSLGVASDLNLTLGQAAVTEEITVTADADPVFSSSRTGAATTVSELAIDTLPTISDRINDFTRLSPQYSGGPFGGAFVGQDNRLNNITIDGSYFNNSFGLAGQPGDRTGVAPVSMSAIQEVQVNTAPFDVRQGHFVGAGVNSITKSGDNKFRGSAYYWLRDDSLVGTEAKDATVNPGTFEFKKYGGFVSGPIVKDKLFFFGLVEDEKDTRPGTTFRANNGGETVGGNVTRVLASDLDALSGFLSSNFDYQTGGYQDYPFETPARRYMGKLDWNLNDRNKVSLRYIHLDSETPVLVSTSSSLGFGGRRSNLFGLNFENSNYTILENIRNFIGEWNSIIGSNSSNTLIAGYSKSDESRGAIDNLFPMVDVLEGGSVYTTFGSEPFTPNNELRYKTFQIQDYFTTTRGSHSVTFGASAERYESENVFFPGSQSAYVYNSLADFYRDANDFLANPNRTTSPVTLRTFQVRWMNIPGLDKPIQPLEVWYTGAFAQDEWQVNRDFKLTYGVRFDVPFFGDTGFTNANADALAFRDEDGNSVQYQTGELPGANVQISPRAGFNWDVKGDRTLQVRGGSGILSGPPIYVWLSNQIGNTGVLTGFAQLSNTTARPFHPDPNHYKPTSVTGEPASSYELAVTDKDFKFPQVWRSNLAVDKRLAWGLVGTLEGMYNRDVNGIYYIDANLPAAQTAFTGVDSRPRWTSRQIYSNVSNNTVLKNQSEGYSWHFSAELKKRMKAGFVSAAYSRTEAKNTIDPGSIARGSWTGNAHPGDPNNPPVAISDSGSGNRVFVAGSYRFDWFKFGSTSVSLFWEGYNAGRRSYIFSGDLNGDGGTGNDLLYIHRDTSEMNFQTLTSGGRTYTPAEQAAAWDAYISQDSYLSKHRGEYAERNGVLLPMVFRTDFSLAQELFTDMGGHRHSLQARVDIFNFSNLLNKNWGVSQTLVSNSPLIARGADSQGRAQYQMRVVNNQLMSTSLQQTASLSDVYRVQFSLKYSFN